MQPLHANEHPNTPPPPTPHNPLPPPEARYKSATQPSRPTPRKIGSLRSTTDVTKQRSDVFDQMKNEMILCETWEDGFDKYLPDIGLSETEMDAEVNRAVADLIAKKHMCEIGRPGHKQLRFSSFLDRPSSKKTTEEKCFKPLVSICAVLANHTLNRRTASSTLIQEPRKYNMAETDGANFKVDAFLKLQQSTMPRTPTTSAPIADLAVPLEYKLHLRDVRRNRQQLMSNAIFCMNDDPRRMHIYGITIEDSSMAVWYFSRSHSAVSPNFDFVKNPRTFIRIMLSLLFANEEELGYDQTVRRHLEGEGKDRKLCFVYRVGDRHFKTRRAIFEHRGLCTTGRATRVWEAIEVQSFENLEPLDGATPVVLKDVWLNSGLKTEGENLRDIFVELEKTADLLKKHDSEPEAFNGMIDDEKEMLRQCLKDKSWKQYFLTVVCDWQGRESKEVPTAAQAFPTLFDLPPSSSTPSSHPYPDHSRSTTSLPANLLPVADQLSPRHYCPKRQYRVVFKEVCEVLHDVRKLHDVAFALQDCVFGLQLLFVAGWVHRDISTGNIYALRDSGSNSTRVRGILADFEYAKPFKPNDVTGSSDPKTGTAYFMAVEIQRQIRFYDPDYRLLQVSENYSWEELSNWKAVTCQDKPKTTSFVIHNFEHDLESIFWILLWTLLARFPRTQQSPEDQAQFAGELYSIFQNTSTCPRNRETVFTQDGELERVLDTWVDKLLEPITKSLEILRKLLKLGYIRRGVDVGDISSYSRLYGQMRIGLARCATKLETMEVPELKLCSSKQDLAAVPASSAPRRPTQGKIKRPRSQSAASVGSNSQGSKNARRKLGDAALSRAQRRKSLPNEPTHHAKR